MGIHRVFGILLVCVWFSHDCNGASLGCVERSLVGQNRLVIPDSSYTASSYLYDQNQRKSEDGKLYWDTRYVPSNAKLDGPFGWSPRSNHDNNNYLQIDLLGERTITAVETQGNKLLSLKEWVTLYKLKFKKDNTDWKDYGVTLQVPTTKYRNEEMTGNTVVRRDLDRPQIARYIRFVPIAYHNFKTMRVNVYIYKSQEAPSVTVTPFKRSVLVKWTITPCPVINITGYIVNITYNGVTNVFQSKLKQYDIKDLRPYSRYDIQVKAMPDGLWSGTKTVHTKIAAPETSPTKVTLKAFFSTLIQVEWTLSNKDLINGPLTGYKIEYTAKGGPSKHVDVGVVNMWNLTSLKKYTQYSVRVSVKNTEYVGPPSDTVIMKTLEDAPSVPVNVKGSLIHPNGVHGPQLLITWDLPREKNGEIRKFILKYFCNDTDDGKGTEKVFPVTQSTSGYRFAVNMTTMGTWIYKLSAFTIKEGPYQDGYASIPAFPPWGSPAVFINTSTIAVSWGVIPSKTLNSNITTYDVKLVLHKMTCTHTNKDKQDKEEMTSVTAEKRSVVLTDLLPCSHYKVFVRGNTKGGAGPYSKELVISTQTDKSFSPRNKEFSSSKNVAVGLVVALLVVIIIMIALALLIWKHRRSRTLFKNNNMEHLRRDPLKPSMLRIDAETINQEAEGGFIGLDEGATIEENAYLNIDELSPLVPNLNFLKADGSIDESFLKKQFKSIPTALQYESKEAVKPYNRNKNRYKNIVTYDRSRVILRTESNDAEYINTASIRNNPADESDYINASFVQGYTGSPRVYIATQGPLPGTVSDFWRMIWDQNTSSIVMLTNIIETGKRKCHQYWPERTDVYDDITVSNHQTQVFADYVIRTFYLYKNDQPSRRVRQFHFTAWPDKGVPQYASSILAFRRKVLELTPEGDVGPTVVHCSAGVGRTGAYIMIDAMLQQAKEQHTLQTYNYLQSIRGDRPYMVQTEDQYIFVHKAIYEDVLCGNTEIQVQDLNISLKTLSMIDEATGIDGLTREFQRLNSVTSKDSNIDEGKRVILSQKGEEEEKYINASYVNTYREKDAYIVTQTPTDSTVGDFWRMVMDYDIGTIVMLNKLQEQDKMFHQYWPEEREVLHISGMNVKQLKVHFVDEIVVRTFQIINSKKSLDVVHLQHIGWDDQQAPANRQSTLNLLNEVEKSQQQVSGRSPVLVHCSNGVGRSGTFCTIASTLERVKQEQVLDVFRTVKSIRSSRPGAVETLDQYKFCYSIVQNYLDSFSEYDNFSGGN